MSAPIKKGDVVRLVNNIDPGNSSAVRNIAPCGTAVQLSFPLGGYHNWNIDDVELLIQLPIEGRTEAEWCQEACRIGAYDYVAPDGRHIRTFTGQRTEEKILQTIRALKAHVERQEASTVNEEDSGCPTCGEDGGTSCGMPNCGLLL